jgi:membrane protein implicated in regulation of membrane protease activity
MVAVGIGGARVHIVLTISLAAILTLAVIVWAIFVLIRAYFRRQQRIRRELKEMKRQQKMVDRKTTAEVAVRL